MLQNASFLAIVGVDTAEIRPPQVCPTELRLRVEVGVQDRTRWPPHSLIDFHCSEVLQSFNSSL